MNGFGRIGVHLDQSGHTTKMVNMDYETDVLGHSRNLLPTFKSMEHWWKPLAYYRTMAVLGFSRDVY